MEDTTAEPNLISRVRGKHIQFESNTRNRFLEMKFMEPNYEYLIQKKASRIGWPYKAMLDFLELEGKDWQATSTHHDEDCNS